MYVSLHNRSAYSFGSSLTMPERLAECAALHGMPAVALTDLHGLYAAVVFQRACDGVGIKPIFGAEFVLADGSSVTLLARDLTGYGNLCRLISLHHLREVGIDWVDLQGHAEGLSCLVNVCTSTFPLTKGGLRGVVRHPDIRPPCGPPWVRGDGRSDVFSQVREMFADRLFFALSIHGPDDIPEVRRAARFADEVGIPVVATCPSRCLGRDEMSLLRALSSIGTLTLLDQVHPDKPEGLWHLRTPDEMQRLFHRRPDALANTLRIAEQCNVRLDLSHNRFPRFESPDGRSAVAHLRERCMAGCRRRYIEQPAQRGMGGMRPTMTEALERLDRELAVIDQVNYAEYFLVFDEIVRYCRREGIATLARGSAADSLVCYALGVSHACPFRFDLQFDRFLNPERAKFSKMADIDLDLPWDQRDPVVRWVYDRWGHDRVAMIGSANTFHVRAAVAELGKVYGLPPHEARGATKLWRHMRSRNWPKAIDGVPEAREIPMEEEPYRTIFQMAGQLEGLPRHWAMHPCGLVISPEPLTDLVPVQRSPKGVLVAQYEMAAIEDLGFIKIDLLGQAGLSVLRDAVSEIERTEDVPVDLDRDVDYSDSHTWDLIAKGDARGVHHIESPAMVSLLQQCNCRDIDCLTNVVAIIRPGAANQGKKETFVRRYQGFEPARYAHPSLVPVLEKTFGLMVFEEHILQMAVAFAGMNVGKADVLRRALNKEHRVLVAQMRAMFFEGARNKGRSADEIERVWQLIEGFSGFMFNKAHSAEYAVEAFQGAWLKRRWPAHWLAAVLSNYRGFYAHSPTLPQILYVLEAMRLGIGFLPPCVNRSREHFSVEYMNDSISRLAPSRATGICDGLQKGVARDTTKRIGEPLCGHDRLGIRIPVTHIKGLSERFVDRYLEEREKERFTLLGDFIRRCRPGEAEARRLLDAGALDGWGQSRPMLFWRLRELSRRTETLWEDEESSPPIELTSPDPRTIAKRETELLGFPVTVDPLTHLGCDDQGQQIDWSRYVPVDQLGQYLNRRVRVCGLMVADRINSTQAGEWMKFVTLGDRTGFVEALLFPDTYRKFGHLTVAHPILAATGRVEPFENRNGLTLRVEHLSIPARTPSPATGPTEPVTIAPA